MLDMPSLLIDQSLQSDTYLLFDSGAFTASHSDSPLSDALGTDELDLLNQLLAFPEPLDAVAAFSPDKTAVLKPTRKRSRCPDCCSVEPEPELQRGPKQRRSGSTDGGKSNKCKSQSQRQREEIALLKQQVEELSAKLVDLHGRQQQRELTEDSVNDSGSSPDLATGKKSVRSKAAMWERVAKRQKTEVHVVEQENASLRSEVAKRWKQMRSLEQSIIGAQVDQLRQANRHHLADELNALNGDE